MGINKLNSLMKTMAQKGGLHAENLTNQSARKRMIQKLNDQEVPPNHIMHNIKMFRASIIRVLFQKNSSGIYPTF